MMFKRSLVKSVSYIFEMSWVSKEIPFFMSFLKTPCYSTWLLTRIFNIFIQLQQYLK